MPEVKAPLGRHTRKCIVCRHPERKGIELEFLGWRSAKDIADDYGVPDYSSIYRHARATKLFERRRANVRVALEPIIEGAEHARVTAEAVVHAVRTYAQINDSGKWVPTTAHVVHHTLSDGRVIPADSPSPLPVRKANRSSGGSKSNRQLPNIPELEGASNG
jgi:hypothetical protein